MGQVPSNLLIPTEEVEVLGRGRVRWGAGGKFIEWDSRSVNVQNSSIGEELLRKYRYPSFASAVRWLFGTQLITLQYIANKQPT